MSKRLRLMVRLQALDKMTRPLRAMTASSQRLKQQIASTRKEVSNVEAQQRHLDKYKQLQEQYSGTKRTLNAVEKEYGDLKKAMGANRGGTKQQIADAEKLEKSLSGLRGERKKQLLQLTDISGKLKAAKVNTRDLARAESTLAEQGRRANRIFGNQETRLKNLTKRSNRFAESRRKMQRVMAAGANMSFVGGAGLLAGGALLRQTSRIIAPGIAFEQEMSSVGALARVSKTSEGFRKLSEQAKELGASTSFSAGQAAQGMQKLAMAGFEVNEILDSMPGMLSLARAGNLDLGEASDIASNILSGFKIEASQMGKVADILTATFTNSNVDLQQLGETMQYVAPVAQKAGISLKTTAAMAGLLGNVGIKASRAGTTLRTSFLRIATHDSAINALNELGIATTDAEGNLRAMPDILNELGAATKHLGNTEQLEVFNDIAGKNAVSGFAELVGLARSGEMDRFLAQFAEIDGEAFRVAKQMQDNIGGDITELKSAWEGLNIAITETNNGPLRAFFKGTTDIVRRLGEWVEQNPVLAGQLLQAVVLVGGLIAAGGGLLLVLAAVIGPLAMLAFTLKLLGVAVLFSHVSVIGLAGRGIALLLGGILSISKVTKAWTITQWLLNAAMWANPLGAIIALVLGLIAVGGILLVWGEDIWDFFTGFFDMLLEKFPVLGKIIDTIGAGVSAIGNMFGSLWGDDTPYDDAVMRQARQATQSPIFRAGRHGGQSRPVALAAGYQPFVEMPAPPNIQTIERPKINQQTTVHEAPTQITMNVHPTPGMSEEKVGQIIAEKIEEVENEQRIRRHGRFGS